MPKYVFYTRTQEGRIERMDNIIVDHPVGGLLGSYKHEVPLLGFPETSVFWASELGATMGIASLTPGLPYKELELRQL